MRIILFSRRQMSRTPEVIPQLFDALKRFGFDYRVNIEFAECVRQSAGIEIPPKWIYDRHVGEQPLDSVMVCYGGDGTLLEGVHRLGGRQIPVLGINAGHLGFLTSAPSEGLDRIFGEIASGKLRLEHRSLLQVEGDFGRGEESHLALNEFAVQRLGAGMISVETHVDDQLAATYHGDGVIVSTPTGSTAYSLSAGGPVVAPTCACMVISPLAPHNLTMRPIVIPDSSVIDLRIKTRHSESFVMLDNRTYPAASGSTFRIRRAEQGILLAIAHNISFYDTLRDKMMWGVDIRS